MEAASQPSLIDEDITNPESLYFRDFTPLTKKPPYQINIGGVVSGTQPVVTTRSGASMRLFWLQDNTGRWVACVVYDGAAEDTCIANGNEVIIFFANAQYGLSNGPGQLWLYGRSHVMLLRVDCRIPPCLTQMEMRGDS